MKPAIPQQVEIGYVTKCNNYLIYLEGLPNVRVNNIIRHTSGSLAMVTKLDDRRIQALMLDKTVPQPGDSFTLFSETIMVPVDDSVLGRVIDPFGAPLDHTEKITVTAQQSPVSVNEQFYGIDKRHIIDTQFITGLSTIDSLLPIGKGQRELIIGEPRSGKTAFLYDVIAHQKNQNTICIYCALGKSELDIKGFYSNIQTFGADTYTVIVAAPSSKSAPLISMAPLTALTIAEYFRDQGRDVLLMMDDMGLHAKYLREISLLAEEVPGRDSYPGSIFHHHARLVERAGNFIIGPDKNATITLLPIIEIIPEAMTSYITTNLMSMTDGHLLFSSELIAAGQYPAVEISRSVTRVGRQTQHPLLRLLSDKIRIILSRYDEVRTYSRFGSELTGETVTILKQSELITELLRQEDHQMRPVPVQILYLTLPFTRFLSPKDTAFVRKHKHTILSAIEQRPELNGLISKLDTLSLDQLIDALNDQTSLFESICQ